MKPMMWEALPPEEQIAILGRVEAIATKTAAQNLARQERKELERRLHEARVAHGRAQIAALKAMVCEAPA